ncbi:unnamed protein product, partial [Durusdinium trenchii]
MAQTMAQTQVPIKSKELHPRPMQLRFKAIQVMVALRKECNPSSRQLKCKVTQVMVTLQECNLLLRSKALLIMVPLKEFNVLLKAQAIQCMVEANRMTQAQDGQGQGGMEVKTEPSYWEAGHESAGGYDSAGTWWEKDAEVEGLWWYYRPGKSWGRWMDKTDGNSMPGGWANKMAVLLQMYQASEFTELKRTLARLSEHHAMQQPVQK